MDPVELIVRAGARAAVLLLGTVIIATVVLVFALVQLDTLLQSYKLVADAPNYTELPLFDQHNNLLCLRVSHPTKLIVDSNRAASEVIVHLLQSDCNPLLIESSSTLQTIPNNILSDTTNLVPTTTTSISVTIISNSHISITDGEGSALPQEFIHNLVPSTSFVLYVHQISSVPMFVQESRTALFIKQNETIIAIPLHLQLETVWNGFWRRVCETVVTNGATVILAFLPILIGVIIVQIGLRDYYWKSQIDNIHSLYTKVSEQAGDGSEEFFAYFREFYQKFHSTWVASEIRSYYEQALQAMELHELPSYLKILECRNKTKPKTTYDILDFFLLIPSKSTVDEDRYLQSMLVSNEAVTCIKELGKEEVERTLEWVILESSFSSEIKLEALAIAQMARSIIDYDKLKNKLDQQYYFAFLSIWRSVLYKAERWPDPIRRSQFSYAHSTSWNEIHRAENDPYLLWHKKWPQWLEEVAREPMPCLILGESGTGKSAAAIQLVHKFATNMGSEYVLPIYWRYDSNAVLQQEPLLSFIKVLAYTLASYLSINPKGYLYISLSQQTAIAHLFTLCFNVEKVFELICTRSQLDRNKDLMKMITIMQELSSQIDYGRLATKKLTNDELIWLLSNAFPAQVTNQTYGKTVNQLHKRWILLDVQQNSISEVTIQTLLQTITLLAEAGYVIKTFLPKEAPIDKWKGRKIEISWTPTELRALLRARLTDVDDDIEEVEEMIELKVLCQRDVNLQELEERIFAASESLPRRLIHIGQLLTKKYEEKRQRANIDDPRLDSQELDEIFNSLDL